MTFTFTNYATPELSKHPLNDIISNMFGGYEKASKAKYLQPSLQEELKKAQLYNQYYGPNMESIMGLRGAQTGQAQAHTGLIGEQLRGLQMQHQYLPQQLQAQAEAQKLAAAQNQMFNQMLQQRLAGNQNQMGMPSPEYMPGQGGAPFLSPEQSAFSQIQAPQNEVFAQPNQNQQNYNIPQMTNDDIINKKLFGIDTFTPKYKATIDAITKSLGRNEAAQFKLDSQKALEDYKETTNAQNDLPVLKQSLEHAFEIKKLIEQNPDMFGHWIAPGYFANKSTNPAVGTFQALLVPQIAEMEKQLSSRGNQLALKTASQKVPGFQESQKSALGKIDALINTLEGRIKITENLAGGNIIRHGTKRYKIIDGKVYELNRGEF